MTRRYWGDTMMPGLHTFSHKKISRPAIIIPERFMNHPIAFLYSKDNLFEEVFFRNIKPRRGVYPMNWSTEQVLALAPDSSSAKAGKDLASPRKWVTLGRDDRATWGECQ